MSPLLLKSQQSHLQRLFILSEWKSKTCMCVNLPLSFLSWCAALHWTSYFHFSLPDSIQTNAGGNSWTVPHWATPVKDRRSAVPVNQDDFCHALLSRACMLSAYRSPRAYPAICRKGHVIRYFFSFNKCTLGSTRNYMKPFGDKFKYVLIYPSKKLNQDALYYWLCNSVGLAVISDILVFFFTL